MPELSEIDEDTMKDALYRPGFKYMRDGLEKFTKDWNKDESNRDQALVV